MLKAIIGAMVVILSVSIGAKCSDVYKKRVEFYVLLSDLNTDLKRNLSFRRESVCNIIDNERYRAAFFDLYEALQQGERRNKVDYSAYLPAFLTDEQKLRLISYFGEIGKNDSDAEEKYIVYNEKMISDELEQCRIELKKYKNMGGKLGLSFGLIIFVLIL